MDNANLWGMVFILTGVVLLLIMYDIISLSVDLLRLWPSIFIVMGIIIIYFKGEENRIEKVKK